MKKRVVSLLLAVMAVATLAGCGLNVNKSKDKETEVTTDNGETLAALTTDEYMTLGEYKNITVDVTKAEVTDEDVETYIVDQLLAGYGNGVELAPDEAVREGDYVEYTCVGKIDGEIFDGGSTPEGEVWTMELGSGGMIPGFEEGILGMKTGETRDVTATFPDDYHETSLRDKEAVFTIHISYAERTEGADELNADVLEYYGFTNEEDCRTQVRKQLLAQAETEFRQSFESAVLDAVYDNCTFHQTPQFLIDTFKKSLEDYYQYYADYYGISLEEFIVNYVQMSMEAYQEQNNSIATMYANQYVLYEAVFDAEGMQLTEEDLKAEADQTAEDYGYASTDALYEDFGESEFRDYVMVQMVIEKILDYAKDVNNVVYDDSVYATEE